MLKLRSIIFSFIFYLWILVAMVLSLPFIFFYPIIYGLHSLWARSVAWLLKIIVGCNSKIEGLSNLPREGGYVIASKHQSAWETIILFKVLPKVCFVYKKELGYIPIYGWYNIAFRNIKVDRKSGATSLKRIVEQAVRRVGKGHQVVIFPQGTRTAFGVRNPYKSATYAMYKEGLPVYPAALNSGNHWPKNGWKKPGTITMKFLERMEDGLSRDEFMAALESKIENESNRLNTLETMPETDAGI